MVALITGGSSGMGLEFARQLAGRGYDLLLVSNKEDDLAKASEELLREYKVRIQTRFQDLAEPSAADDLFADPPQKLKHTRTSAKLWHIITFFRNVVHKTLKLNVFVPIGGRGLRRGRRRKIRRCSVGVSP